MPARRSAATVLGSLLLTGTVVGAAAAQPAPTPQPRADRRTPRAASLLAAGVHAEPVCDDIPGQARCGSLRLEDHAGHAVAPNGRRLGHDVPTSRGDDDFFTGYTPQDIQRAYAIGGARSGGRTVAVVAGYGYAKAEADLVTYRKRFGLPECTTANGCLTIVDQRGGHKLPPEKPEWAAEQALDLDAVSAACPDCKLLLVQADNALPDNLAQAVDTAAKHPGVAAISNSYTVKDVDDRRLGAHFDHPGIAITAATGDGGYEGPVYPASSAHVTAVGGTFLLPDTKEQRGFREFVWSGSGSGCLAGQAAPGGQDPKVTGCAGRAMADVAAAAEPATGLAAYSAHRGGWAVMGGTSLAAPLVAAMYALAGPPKGAANAAPYAHPGEFYDITQGKNGSCEHFCKGQPGWDGPTGVGAPKGVRGLTD